ncbi:MAG: hypothetical protein M1836_000343 [Candelina mexicana]|nr:MAG: hypothetical protein M1836_000343 [Candelina mexicana]
MAWTQEQIKGIIVTERTVSALSIIGASFIIITFLTSSAFQKPINRLVFFASWGNIMCNIGTMMSRSGIDAGVRSPLCQIQGLIIQWFLPADSLFTLAMACNVYLTFFRKYTASHLRALEWKYIVACYGIPLIPAFVYEFIDTKARGKVYGSATLWCWISVQWDFLRVAVFYGPVWIVIGITLAIYLRTGYEIFSKKRQLQSFDRSKSVSTVENPFVSTVTTDIRITTAMVDPMRNSSQTSLNFAGDEPSTIQSAQGYEPYSVTIESCGPPPPRSLLFGPKSPILGPPATPAQSEKRNSTATGYSHGGVGRTNPTIAANKAAWGYTQCAFLFFIALVVTWVPSSINRVYSLAHPDRSNVVLNYMSATVLPLQGFWNAIIYIATSRQACSAYWQTLRGRVPRPRLPRRPTQLVLPSGTKKSSWSDSGTELASPVSSPVGSS